MTLFLYECLKAIGLQCHYARFTSGGVCSAAHLSALTLEDYPILGIHSMEERIRLFQLVQLVKTLDLRSLGCRDGDANEDANADCGAADGAAAGDSSAYDGLARRQRGHDESAAAAAPSTVASPGPSCVRRRLDFSCENPYQHQKYLSGPVDTAREYAGQSRRDEPAPPAQLRPETTSAAGRVCKSECGNQRADVPSHPSDHHTGGGSRPDTTGGGAACDAHPRLSPERVSYKPKLRPAVRCFGGVAFGDKDVKTTMRREKLFAEKAFNLLSEGMARPAPVYQSKRAAGYNYGLPLSPASVSNKNRQAGEQRISVCVRKRPLTRTESRRGEADVVTTPAGECVLVHECKEAVDLTQYTLQHKFYFDWVFGEESSNEEVYQRTAHPLVRHMLNGGKATCFAYGQTGAGKTHTMLGSSPGRPGLYALAVREIFAHLCAKQTPSPLLVYVSFFEIYCGQLYDLLNHRKRLFAREDGHKMVHIAGLRDVRVDSVSSLMEVITQGTEVRTQGVSGVNPLSSRSHALLQIQLRCLNQQITGRMWFVDLAGSERASDSKGPNKQSRMEGADINQSLLALKECIRSLDQEQSHTPFRQSKLTQVLKDSFVGDSMTCMIANISPGHLATEHTLNTLRYADRVKELKGQGGLGGGICKVSSSPKRNLSHRNRSSSSRGKSTPKKPKNFTSPTPKMPAGGAVLCSTPKKGSGRPRPWVGFEQMTPVRGSLGTDDKRQRGERTGEREVGRQSSGEKFGRTDCLSNSDRNKHAGPVLGQPAAEPLHLSHVQRESGLNNRDTETQERTLKLGKDQESKCREQRGQMENKRDTDAEVEKTGEKDFQKVEEKDKERESHLRRYHQHLQQFVPSPASSSRHLSSPLTWSLSSSGSPSTSSSLAQSSQLSMSARMYHGIKEVLDAYGASVEVQTGGNMRLPFPCGDNCLHIETPPGHVANNDEYGFDVLRVTGQDQRVCWEEAEATARQDRDTHEQRRSSEATDEGEVRVRAEDRTLALVEGGQTRWAWGAKTKREQADRMSSGPLRGDCGQEETNASRDGAWNTIDGSGCAASAQSTNKNNSLPSHPSGESPHQQAPAERPLSPACEHTNILQTPNKFGDLSLESKHTRSSNMPPLLQNSQQVVSASCSSSSSSREKRPCSADNVSKRDLLGAQLAALPLDTFGQRNGCKIPVETLNKLSGHYADTQVHNNPELKAKMPVLPQKSTSADSLSFVMDPLSVSLLQVEQQVATASFLSWEQGDASFCPLKSEEEDNKRKMEKEHLVHIKDEDIEFCPSFLELPQAKNHCRPTYNTMTASNCTGLRKESCGTHKHCRKGMMESPPPKVILVSPQGQKNGQATQIQPAVEIQGKTAPASPHSLSPYASGQTISSPLQRYVNTVSPTSTPHYRPTNGTRPVPQNACKPALPDSSPRSENVMVDSSSVPNQCRSCPSHPGESSVSPQINSPPESSIREGLSSQEMRAISHLSTLGLLDQAQWCVVQAHWDQLEEMKALCHTGESLLCQQPDMAFGEYVHKLDELMEREARCVQSMRSRLQLYLKTSPSSNLQQK